MAFDFDGTITTKDTFRLFLTQVRGPRELATTFIRHAPQLGLALQGGAARDRAKQLICMDVLGGLDRRVAEEAAAETARQVEGSLIRPDAADRIRWHQAEGHRIIVVSASFGAYVTLVAASLGIDEVIATRWEVDPDDRDPHRPAGRSQRPRRGQGHPARRPHRWPLRPGVRLREQRRRHRHAGPGPASGPGGSTAHAGTPPDATRRAPSLIGRSVPARHPRHGRPGPQGRAGVAASLSGGGMRERTNRTVSKTVVSQGTVGSNPTPSASAMSPGVTGTSIRSRVVSAPNPGSTHAGGTRGGGRLRSGRVWSSWATRAAAAG